MTIGDIIRELETVAPPAFQEDYDNAGLITGDVNQTATGALLSLDCTEEVVQEAVSRGCNLIISHHPVLFAPIKKLTPHSMVERSLLLAIRNGVAIYACHTNLDNVHGGVNSLICRKLGLQEARILLPKPGTLFKLVTFVPADHHVKLLSALFKAGAGHIGNYSHCSFSQQGEGPSLGGEGANPYVGEKGKLSREKEIRAEVIVDVSVLEPVRRALLAEHPYEEVVCDIYRLENSHPTVGSGMLARFLKPLPENEFLSLVKKTFGAAMLRHTALTGRLIGTVAVCGGSGRFLLKHAIAAGADAFVTSDFKYHEFFEVERRLLLIDTGHYESEQFSPEIFYDLIREKFSTFAVHLSKINTNPINYF